MDRTTKTWIRAGLLAVGVTFSGAGVAAEFADGAQVTITGLGAQSNFTLKKQGEDGNGDGIYLIQSAPGPYLMVMKPDEGEMVGFTNGDDVGKASKWIIHKNGSGNDGAYSIISADNGANTVARVGDGKQLQRNQGSKDQLWSITAR